MKADGFLVIVHGAAEQLARAQAILAFGNPSQLDLHDGLLTLSAPTTAIGRAAVRPLSL